MRQLEDGVSENWHEERDRLVKLLKGMESGKVTHIHEDELAQLQLAGPKNIAAVKDRLAQLDARIGNQDRPTNQN